LQFVGTIDFYNGDESEVPFGIPSWRVHFFLCTTFEGTPINTIEMQNHNWYEIDNLPATLVAGDDIFISKMLKGQMVNAWIRRSSDFSKVLDYKIS